MSHDCLVLSGGGVKGFFLLGAIQACIEKNCLEKIHTYIGSSVGAMISYLLVLGYTPIELIVAIHVNKWLDKLQGMNIGALLRNTGVISFTPLHEALEKLTIDKTGRYFTLAQLREKTGKTLVCAAYNMTSCEIEYLHPDTHPDLPCLAAIRMSCNIPIVFDRFKYTNSFYIDGGIVDNFPVLQALKYGKKILGVSLNIQINSLRDNPEEGLLPYMVKLFYTPVLHGLLNRIEQAKTEINNRKDGSCLDIISINTGVMRSLIDFDVDIGTRLDMFSEGYKQAKNQLFSNKAIEKGIEKDIEKDIDHSSQALTEEKMSKKEVDLASGTNRTSLREVDLASRGRNSSLDEFDHSTCGRNSPMGEFDLAPVSNRTSLREVEKTIKTVLEK
jgi:predicted acylesterase/phospholipase RssA